MCERGLLQERGCSKSKLVSFSWIPTPRLCQAEKIGTSTVLESRKDRSRDCSTSQNSSETELQQPPIGFTAVPETSPFRRSLGVQKEMERTSQGPSVRPPPFVPIRRGPVPDCDWNQGILRSGLPGFGRSDVCSRWSGRGRLWGWRPCAETPSTRQPCWSGPNHYLPFVSWTRSGPVDVPVEAAAPPPVVEVADAAAAPLMEVAAAPPGKPSTSGGCCSVAEWEWIAMHQQRRGLPLDYTGRLHQPT